MTFTTKFNTVFELEIALHNSHKSQALFRKCVKGITDIIEALSITKRILNLQKKYRGTATDTFPYA